MTKARALRQARPSLSLKRRNGVIRRRQIETMVVRGMPDLTLGAMIARLYRNDPSFVTDWYTYMRENRRARFADPLYDDVVHRIYRRSAKNVAHLTYSTIDDAPPPVLLCGRRYRIGSDWSGWDSYSSQRARRLDTCLACQLAYDEQHVSDE